eukprot:1886292-Prymnesium_polylepis.1
MRSPQTGRPLPPGQGLFPRFSTCGGGRGYLSPLGSNFGALLSPAPSPPHRVLCLRARHLYRSAGTTPYRPRSWLAHGAASRGDAPQRVSLPL